jgi:hypothetical protein
MRSIPGAEASAASFAGSVIIRQFNPKLAKPRMGLDCSASFAGSLSGAFAWIRRLSKDELQNNKSRRVHRTSSTYVRLKSALIYI